MTAAEQHKRALGQYLTPLVVAEFMANLFASKRGAVRILDPGAGAGILCCALCESLTSRSIKPERVEVHTYEADASLHRPLEVTLAHTGEWLRARGIRFRFTIREDDFVLEHAESLDDVPRLFRTSGETEGFDAIIANPPYFKIPKSDPRARLCSTVVYGQPNIYALFMAISAALLKSHGELVCITPRSYAAGSYFRLFRERFFGLVRPTRIHLFGSRTETFSRDEVLQENVILAGRRDDGWFNRRRGRTVNVSCSDGARDLSDSAGRRVPLCQVLRYDSQDKTLRIPLSDEHDEAARLVRSWPGNLRAYGLEISTGPVVAFRAAALLSKRGRVPATHAPLLWMQNVQAMKVLWPVETRGKEQYLRLCEDAKPVLLPNRNYVLLRRFSAKEQSRRLVAAAFLSHEYRVSLVGLENHLNYVHRPGGMLSEEEAYGLALLFNSGLIDAYFRTSNGNTQVSAAELRVMPLPPLESIIKIGRRAMHAGATLKDVDDMLTDMYGWAPNMNGSEQVDYVEG